MSTEPNSIRSLEYVSYSRLNMFKRCAKQYYYRYPMGLIIPPKWVMTGGKVGHSVLEYNNLQKMVTGKDISTKESSEYFVNEWDKALEEEEVVFGKDKPLDARDKVRKTLDNYIENNPDKEDIPVEVEQEFNIKVNDIPVKGFIDVTFKDKLKDYKFSGRSPSAIDLHNNSQISLYAVQHQLDKGFLPQLYFDYMIFTKTPKKEIIMIQRTPEMLERAMDDLTETTKLLEISYQTGLFPRNSNGWHCGPEYCGYWDKCKPGETKVYHQLSSQLERIR